MIPARLLCCTLQHGELVPGFLAEHDHPWLRCLFDEAERMQGRRFRELAQRLAEPLARAAPPQQQALAAHVLQSLVRATERAAVPPSKVRAALFGAAALLERDAAFAVAAKDLGISADDVQASLFADLPGERRVVGVPPDLSLSSLVLRANLALAQALLGRAARVRVEVRGNARAVVRHAKLRGLLCTVTPSAHDDGAVLELSGPLSLFRRTTLYGRALATLLPVLAWCERYHLSADVVLRGREHRLELATGAPLWLAPEPTRFDSRVEERFFRDVGKVALDWELVREPQPVRAGKHLVFPDFALRHRRDGGRAWLVELVGFWTRAYLEHKLASYRQARLERLILCIDEELRCDEGELPRGARVLWYRRRVDARRVLEIVEAEIAPR
ncbi:MAG: DUF790 family protein [Deltaproteobacteria bacterium]|nr:DUF790 family protein [Deltaproteobacteria bacterium]